MVNNYINIRGNGNNVRNVNSGNINISKNINPGGNINSTSIRGDKGSSNQNVTFGDVLKDKIESSQVKFSKHAQMRLETRNINLTNTQKEKLSQGVKRAEEKGVKESLIMVDDIAMVVNIKNKMVITAVNSNELKENVFTNIDGAVFT